MSQPKDCDSKMCRRRSEDHSERFSAPPDTYQSSRVSSDSSRSHHSSFSHYHRLNPQPSLHKTEPGRSVSVSPEVFPLQSPAPWRYRPPSPHPSYYSTFRNSSERTLKHDESSNPSAYGQKQQFRQGIDRLTNENKQSRQGMDRMTNESKQSRQGMDRLTNESKQSRQGMDRLTNESKQSRQGMDRLTNENKQSRQGMDSKTFENKQSRLGMGRLTNESKQSRQGMDRLTNESKQPRQGMDRLTNESKQPRQGMDSIASENKHGRQASKQNMMNLQCRNYNSQTRNNSNFNDREDLSGLPNTRLKDATRKDQSRSQQMKKERDELENGHNIEQLPRHDGARNLSSVETGGRSVSANSRGYKRNRRRGGKQKDVVELKIDGKALSQSQSDLYSEPCVGRNPLLQGNSHHEVRDNHYSATGAKTVVTDLPNKVDTKMKQIVPETELSSHTTRATLKLWTLFADESCLKEAIISHFNLSEKTAVLTFVENSFFCINQKTSCIITVQAESKLSAKYLIQKLCNDLRTTLGAKIYYDISKAEEKLKVLKPNAATLDQVHQNRGPVTTENVQPRVNLPKAEPVLETVVREEVKSFHRVPTDGGCNSAADTNHSSRQKKTSNCEKDPFSSPTKIIVTIGKFFPQNGDVCDFLQRVCENVSTYKILNDTIVISKLKTRCDLIVSSIASAKKLVKHMNRCRLDNVNINAHYICEKLVKNVTTQPGYPNLKIEKILQEVQKKISKVLEAHKEKIKECEDALNVMESIDKNDEDNLLEVLTLRAKLTEVSKQQEEYIFQQDILTKRIMNLDPQKTSESDLTDLMQNVGIECERLTKALPIYARRKDIVEKISTNQVSIIVGETGSGKSTQMVQYLFDAGLAGSKQIVCTQPRKIAAITLAERVAKEMVCHLGSTVGFKIGGNQNVLPTTKIVFTTDHCLLNECLTDPELTRYSCVIVDEAHERSLFTDLLLGMIKACLPKRPDLKVVITSATINPEIFMRYFSCSSELRVSGRTFPVDVIYTESKRDEEFKHYESRVVKKAVEVHSTEEQGDILIFLPSPVEIMKCCAEFKEQMNRRVDFKCFPLHGQLLQAEQKKVFEQLPRGTRKLVFATNCAETSVTIDGIKYVIDPGISKEMRYDAKRNINLLGTHVISKSSADQRKGRAGRTARGKCYRLYSEESYKSMAAISEPEILRIHLGQAVLKLAEMGIDVKKYDFIEPPSIVALDSAVKTLRELQALSAEGITDIGRWIVKLPLDPRQGYLVYEGYRNNLLYDCIVIACLISNGSSLFYRSLLKTEDQKIAHSKHVFGSVYGDIFTWLEMYKHYTIAKDKARWCIEKSVNYKAMMLTFKCIREVSSAIKREFNIDVRFTFAPESALDTLRKLIFLANTSSICNFSGRFRAGYWAFFAEKQVHFHPSSILVTQNAQPEWIVFTEFTKTSRDFIKGITVVDYQWILEAISEGRLNEDIQDRQHKIELVHREEVGSYVFYSLVGPRFSHLRILEDELINSGMSNMVIEADRQLLTVDFYSSSPMNPEMKSRICETKNEFIERLCSFEAEIDVKTGSSNNGFRAVLGQGGSVRAFLMPHQSRKILIHKSSHHTSVDDIRVKFRAFGNIKECVQFRSSKLWGFVRYESHLEALTAVESTKNDENCAAFLDNDNRSQKFPSGFEAELSWCRRPIKIPGTAFIQCPPLEKAALIGREIYISGNRCEIKMSKKNSKDLICFFSGNTNEMCIKEQVIGILNYDDTLIRDINVNVLRHKVEPLSQKELSGIQDYLSNQFANHISDKTSFNLILRPAKPNSVTQFGYINFSNPIVGFQTCRRLSGQLFVAGQQVEISPKLKTTIHVPKRIMEVCEDKFEEMIRNLKIYKQTEAVRRKLPHGDFAIEIKSSVPKCIIEARDIFQTELDGEFIDCGINEICLNLLKRQGKEFLHKIEKDMDVIIMTEYQRQKVRIYGTQEKITQVKSKINQYLNNLAEGKQVDIHFGEVGKPPGLMKALLKKYGNLHDDLIEEFGITDVIIHFRLQKITLMGPSEAVDKVCLMISKLEQDLPHSSTTRENWTPECAVCLCAIDDLSDLYRLEGCGHSYCIDCLKHHIMADVSGKNFPIFCARKNCNMQMVLKDIQQSTERKWISAEKLVQNSVTAYVSANSTKFRFCLTPNCSVIYEVTNDGDGHEFNCPSCMTSLCTSCHQVYHAGLTCTAAVSQKEADKQLEEWKRANADTCKNCPGCYAVVEKVSGCNKMHCLSCRTYFCWICLERAQDSQRCYAHLAKVHGGFY